LIYTATGPILLAVNPFKSIPKLYSNPKPYLEANSSSLLPPHPWALAHRAYAGMNAGSGKNQTILISGGELLLCVFLIQ
jgi:myosin heavy subunit